jgi:hypothetical protein
MYCLKSISKLFCRLSKRLVTENCAFITSEIGITLPMKTKAISLAAYFVKCWNCDVNSKF